MGPVKELSNARKTKFAEYGFAPLKKQINEGFTEGALRTSQLCHNFQAIQAVHGADDITTPNFYSQVDSLGICGIEVFSRERSFFSAL